jgi:rhamnulose-1-phosphate aldolase/alcohol dehydrogenase
VTERHTLIEELLERSHRLGADRTVTNFGGGNTSAKGWGIDPATGERRSVLYVKGSGGDLGTLGADGLATLDLQRLQSAAGRYRADPGQGEDHFAGLVSLCGFGAPGAAPSIDTTMHALLEIDHVDHLHPDAIIALAAASDGERLVKECFGGDVAWVPWRRPGIDLALEVSALLHDNPDLKGVVLGGHGLTAWADTSTDCEAVSLDIIGRASAFLAQTGRAEPFGPMMTEAAPLPTAQRHQVAAALAPIIRALCSSDGPRIVSYCDADDVLDFVSREAMPRLAALGTSCPDHFLRTKVRPLVLDLPAHAALADQTARLAELHGEYRRDYANYYARYAGADTPPMRGADPTVVLVPGIGMFSAGPQASEARITGEFYRNAIAVMHGAEAVSTYAPISEPEKFEVEYWSLEEAKLARRPPARRLAGRVALVTGAGSGIGRAIATKLANEGACVVATDRDEQAAAETAQDIGGEQAFPLHLDVRQRASIDEALAATCLRFGGVDIVINNAGLSISRSLAETTEEDWDSQHDVMAKGSFLVSQAAAGILAAQGMGGDIVYIVSKNAVVAGPSNIAYSSAKADQAHQVRLLASELGSLGVRVNGINPDGVVRDSGIFASGWGAERAAAYNVAEEDLGKFYAERTILKREVLPAHVADAVFALVSGDLSLTTGLHVPVDGGVPAAFLR